MFCQGGRGVISEMWNASEKLKERNNEDMNCEELITVIRDVLVLWSVTHES